MFDPIDYTPTSFQLDWDSAENGRNWLRDLYNRVRYPLLTAYLRRVIPETVMRYSPDWVLGSGVGIPRSITRHRISQLMAGKAISRLLVLGCGTAWDFGQWARLRPHEMLGVDLYSFRRAWSEVTTMARTHAIDVRFLQADMSDLSPIEEGWADVVITDAVFEHCVDLKAVLGQIRRTLRPGGLLYASYGPLWFSPAGDHYSTRGGLQSVFNHLLLEKGAYQAFFEKHLQSQEDPQNGGRYVLIDLFSKLSSDQYLELYEQLGWQRRSLVLELSPLTIQFKKIHQQQWQALLRQYPCVRAEEFVIKGHYVILQR